jgi:hypothetical protein
MKRKFGWARTVFVDFAGQWLFYCSKSGGIWTAQTDLQQIYPKSDSLLVVVSQCLVKGGATDGGKRYARG